MGPRCVCAQLGFASTFSLLHAVKIVSNCMTICMFSLRYCNRGPHPKMASQYALSFRQAWNVGRMFEFFKQFEF